MQTPRQFLFVRVFAACGLAAVTAVGLAAQAAAPASQAAPGSKPTAPAAPAAPAPAPAPADYIIGPDDVLAVVVWKEQGVSGEFGVRPDGKISVPLINDVLAAGKTPDELRTLLTSLFKGYFTDPVVSVVVKQINSRKVFITGNVGKAGPYPLTSPTTVLQLIAQAGGLAEFAKGKEIVVIRAGVSTPFKVNYEELKKGKNLKQNIELKPGDQVIVP